MKKYNSTGVMTTQRATVAVVVTSGELTRAVIDAASRQPKVQLVDGAMLREWIDVAALEAEEARQQPEGDAANDDWKRAFTEQLAARASTARSRNDNVGQGVRSRHSYNLSSSRSL